MQLVKQTGIKQLPHDRYRPAQYDPPDRRVVLQRPDGLDEIAPQLFGVALGELQRAA
jgi:hypothetical protein